MMDRLKENIFKPGIGDGQDLRTNLGSADNPETTPNYSVQLSGHRTDKDRYFPRTNLNYSIYLKGDIEVNGNVVEDEYKSNIYNHGFVINRSQQRLVHTTNLSIGSISNNTLTYSLSDFNDDFEFDLNVNDGTLIKDSLKFYVELEGNGFKTVDGVTSPVYDIKNYFELEIDGGNGPVSYPFENQEYGLKFRQSDLDSYRVLDRKKDDWLSSGELVVNSGEVKQGSPHKLVVNKSDFSIDDDVEVTGLKIVNHNSDTIIEYTQVDDDYYEVLTFTKELPSIYSEIKNGFGYIYEESDRPVGMIDEFYLYGEPYCLDKTELFEEDLMEHNRVEPYQPLVKDTDYFFEYSIDNNSPLVLFGERGDETIQLRRVFFSYENGILKLTNTEYKKPQATEDGYVIYLNYQGIKNLEVSHEGSNVQYSNIDKNQVSFDESEIDPYKEYKITYRLKDSFIATRNTAHKNVTKIKFTDDYDKLKAFFETGDKFHAGELPLSNDINDIDEGFIQISSAFKEPLWEVMNLSITGRSSFEQLSENEEDATPLDYLETGQIKVSYRRTDYGLDKSKLGQSNQVPPVNIKFKFLSSGNNTISNKELEGLNIEAQNGTLRFLEHPDGKFKRNAYELDNNLPKTDIFGNIYGFYEPTTENVGTGNSHINDTIEISADFLEETISFDIDVHLYETEGEYYRLQDSKILYSSHDNSLSIKLLDSNYRPLTNRSIEAYLVTDSGDESLSSGHSDQFGIFKLDTSEIYSNLDLTDKYSANARIRFETDNSSKAFELTIYNL